MTKEEALKWSELFKAFAEDKIIQWLNDGKEWENYEWFTINTFSESDLKRLRIKPTPKYIPYTWEDCKEFMGKKIKGKTDGDIVKITGLNIDCIIRINKHGEEWASPYKFMFETYTYLDGTPFGKLVEE